MVGGKGGGSGRKTTSFDEQGIQKLAKDKPVVYTIENAKGDPLYVGSAKLGRVQPRITEHLPKGPDPVRGGAKVRIEQKDSIAAAEKAEDKKIKELKPPQNKKGK